MRKITEQIPEQTTQHNHEWVRYTMTINRLLHAQIMNLLKVQHGQGDFTYPTFSDFIRESLVVLLEGKITLDYQLPVSPTNKRDVGVRLSPILADFYQSFPRTKRSQILNLVVRSYWQSLQG